MRLADGRYWHGERMQRMVDRRIQLLIPPDISRRRATRCSWDGGRYEQIREVLARDLGRELYIRSMTSQGSAYARFQRALKTGNLTLIRNAAAELPRVDLGDALAVRIAIRQAEPDRFERAALRWLARFCLERREATLAKVQAAAWAFDKITAEPAALDTLLPLGQKRIDPQVGEAGQNHNRRLNASSRQTQQTGHAVAPVRRSIMVVTRCAVRRG